MRITRRSLMGWMGMTGGAIVGSRWLDAGAGLAAQPPVGVAGMLDAVIDASSANPFGPTRWQTSAQKKRELASDITWLTHEPLEFLIRRGSHFDDEPRQYDQMVEPDNIKRMAAAGVKWGRIFFYKGFGLEYERPRMDIAQRAADLMHSLGMKVSLYMAGTMFPETLYHETPEAKNWEQRDQNDLPMTYGTQTFRRYACPNEPRYRDYLKRILQIGVKELHADEIAFDQIMLLAEPKSCRCPRCMKAFADFLRARYPGKDALMRRFAIPDADWIRVNEWESFNQPDGLTTMDDPVLQEWVRFRCESMANHSKALYDIVKGLNPDVAVLLNLKGIFSFNRYWTNAIYHPLFADHIDIMSFDTGGYEERIDSGTGALVSQIRSYKVARRLGCACEDSFASELRAAVHMSFGIQSSAPGATPPPWGPGAHNVFSPIVEFFREYNNRYYTETQNVADVAVIRTWPSMAYSINANYIPAALMEQVFIQYKIPFDILFDEQLDRIGQYQAVVLAGQDCVSDAQIQMLLQYVRKGGTLATTGGAGQFNDWRERRRSNPLSPDRTEGAGRIVVIPDIASNIRLPAIEPNVDPFSLSTRSAPKISPSQWVLPTNHADIYKALSAAFPKGFSLTTEAPLTTVAELVSRPKTRETIAHFVNFDRENPLPPFAAGIRKQFPGPIKSVTHFSPDADDPIPLAFKESGDVASVTIPATRIYSMTVVAQ
jgi:Beta-galactosidase